MFNDWFQLNPASSYGPLSWQQQPNHQHRQRIFAGCRSTRCEWEQLEAVPDHFPYLRCEHHPHTTFLLHVSSSLVLSNRPAAEKQTTLPISLSWAQLGWVPALGHVVAARAGWVNSEGNAADAQEHVGRRGAAQAALTHASHWCQISKHGLSFS